MSIGAQIRRWFGPREADVSNLYRACFFDLGTFTRSIKRWLPDAGRILEIGCGEGAICERLAALYPQARIVGIDIMPKVGRLFRGDRTRVSFAQQTIQDFAPAHHREFDLVLICDVLHHVPWHLHVDLLRAARGTLRPGGGFVLKDWEKRLNFAHVLSYLSDRYLTGDRIRFGTAWEFRREIHTIFGTNSIERERRFQPWPNNLAFFIRNH